MMVETALGKLEASERPLEHVVDLCSPDLISLLTMEEAADAFRSNWGRQPSSIAIPVAGHGGASFEVHGVPYSPLQYRHAQRELGEFAALARAEMPAESVYLVLKPDMRALTDLPWLVIEDITGDMSAQLCIGNGRVQDLWARTIRQAVLSLAGAGVEPAGLAIDVVDLWPMGADDNRIEATCFCADCRAFLQKEGVEVHLFEDFPSPLNIALRDTGTGIGFMDDLTSDTSPERIIGMSRVRRFWDAEKLGVSVDANPRGAVGALLAYMRARHKQTVTALNGLFHAFTDACPSGSRIVLVESGAYGWTSGLFLDGLDSREVCDELWTDPGRRPQQPQDVRVRYYMWRRARYIIDAFFDAYSSLVDPRAMVGTRFGERNPHGIVKLRWAQTSVAASGRQVADGLSEEVPMPALVGPPLNADVGRKLVDSQRRGETPIGELREGADRRGD